jgi:hypothetical protein
MANPAREVRISRRSWLLAGLGIGVFRLRGAVTLALSFDGDDLRVAAPDLHFLTGKPLERLKDGATVTFLSQLTLFSDPNGTVFKRSPIERLVVSYDLWEKNFSVRIPGGGNRGLSSKSAAEVESWCLENLAISAMGLAPDRPFWLKFELKTPDRRDYATVVGDTGLSVRTLIEVFSRKSSGLDFSATREFGPFRLKDLPRTPRGRIG